MMTPTPNSTNTTTAPPSTVDYTLIAYPSGGVALLLCAILAAWCVARWLRRQRRWRTGSEFGAVISEMQKRGRTPEQDYIEQHFSGSCEGVHEDDCPAPSLPPSPSHSPTTTAPKPAQAHYENVTVGGDWPGGRHGDRIQSVCSEGEYMVYDGEPIIYANDPSTLYCNYGCTVPEEIDDVYVFPDQDL